MWRHFVQLGCFSLALMLIGCKGMFSPLGLPPDPLFANRKPIESKAKTGPPVETPFSEPTPPVNPYYAEPVPGAGPILPAAATKLTP